MAAIGSYGYSRGDRWLCMGRPRGTIYHSEQRLCMEKSGHTYPESTDAAFRLWRCTIREVDFNLALKTLRCIHGSGIAWSQLRIATRIFLQPTHLYGSCTILPPRSRTACPQTDFPSLLRLRLRSLSEITSASMGNSCVRISCSMIGTIGL